MTNILFFIANILFLACIIVSLSTGIVALAPIGTIVFAPISIYSLVRMKKVNALKEKTLIGNYSLQNHYISKKKRENENKESTTKKAFQRNDYEYQPEKPTLAYQNTGRQKTIKRKRQD